MPEMPIFTDESTVMVFSIPETVMLAHVPVITTVLLTPLTATSPSAHTTVSFSPTPETVTTLPGTAVASVGAR